MGRIHAVEMIDTHCHICTIAFSVPKAFDDARQNDGIAFNCPNGHSLVYRESKLDKALEELVKVENENLSLKNSRDAWINSVAILEKSNDSLRKEITAYKGHLTRLRNKLNQ